MEQIEKRIAALETLNHRWRLFAISLCLIGLVLVVIGAAQPEDIKVHDMIKAKRINILDDDGTIRLSLGTHKDNKGGVMLMFDNENHSLIFTNDGLLLLDGEKVMASYSSKGMSLVNKSNNQVGSLFVDDKGNGQLLICDQNDKGHVSIVPVYRPEHVWEQMVMALRNGSAADALQYIASRQVDSYQDWKSWPQERLEEFGNELSEKITVITADDKTAIYRLNFVPKGEIPISFNITFVKENGQWKICEF